MLSKEAKDTCPYTEDERAQGKLLHQFQLTIRTMVEAKEEDAANKLASLVMMGLLYRMSAITGLGTNPMLTATLTGFLGMLCHAAKTEEAFQKGIDRTIASIGEMRKIEGLYETLKALGDDGLWATGGTLVSEEELKANPQMAEGKVVVDRFAGGDAMRIVSTTKH